MDDLDLETHRRLYPYLFKEGAINDETKEYFENQASELHIICVRQAIQDTALQAV
jgi:hypothetical protein